MNGKRMRRVDRERRQQREDIVQEMVFDPASFGFGDIPPIDQNDTHIGENAAQIAPDRLLVVGQCRNRFVDQHKLLGRSEAVGTALGNALAHLGLDAGDPNHEEFIKVIGGNGEKPNPLERRMTRIDRFLQHPAVEMEPGKLAIDEPFRTVRDRRAASASTSFSLITMACADSMKFNHPERKGRRSSRQKAAKNVLEQ